MDRLGMMSCQPAYSYGVCNDSYGSWNSGYSGCYSPQMAWGNLLGGGWNSGCGCPGGSYFGNGCGGSTQGVFRYNEVLIPQYENYTERQAQTTQQQHKMWDVWFDSQNGSKTTQRSPIVLDLNGNGKADITGKNIRGDGKITGQPTMFDLDPENTSWQFNSIKRRPGHGAPKVAGGHWEGKKYLDKSNHLVGELKMVEGKERYHWGAQEPREKTEWLKKNGGDGLLVWDVNHDGKINSSKELFGNYDTQGKKRFANGYQKLGHYFDKDKNGKVEGRELSGLQIWKDNNANGKVESGELQSLQQHNITSFDVKNYGKKSMEGSYETTQTTYRDVERTRLTGFTDLWSLEYAGSSCGYW